MSHFVVTFVRSSSSHSKKSYSFFSIAILGFTLTLVMYVSVSRYEQSLKVATIQTQLDKTIQQIEHQLISVERDLWRLATHYRETEAAKSLASSGELAVEKQSMITGAYLLKQSVRADGSILCSAMRKPFPLFTTKSESVEPQLSSSLGDCEKLEFIPLAEGLSLIVEQEYSGQLGSIYGLIPLLQSSTQSESTLSDSLLFTLDLGLFTNDLIELSKEDSSLNVEVADSSGHRHPIYQKRSDLQCQGNCQLVEKLQSNLVYEFAGTQWHLSLTRAFYSEMSMLALSSSLLVFTITLFALWNMYKQINRTKWAQQLVSEKTKSLKESNRALAKEIKQRKSIEKELEYKAAHDPLTGLFNRAEFERHLTEELPALQQSNPAIAVLFVDLDNFKLINDGMGHLAGDKVLQLVAQRLRRVLRKGDILARFGGDEFVILQKGIRSDAESLALSKRIHQSLAMPMSIDDENFYVNVSIGAHVVNQSDITYDAILRSADTAMYEAKRSGRNNTQLFKPALHQQAVTQLYMERELNSACEHEQLFLQYQPIYSASQKVQHLEVLVRWLHPELGCIGPDKFIPIAEANGFIHTLGSWVFKQACKQLAVWSQEQPLTPLPKLNINLSPKQFESNELLARIDSALAETGVSPQQINIEITESCLIQQSKLVAKNIQGLHQRKFAIFLDDFGTGYSSLSQLYRPELEALKIDKSFVWQLNASEHQREAKLLEGIIALANGLGIQTVAEGVETPEQEAILKKLGCHLFQGYYYSKPVDPVAILPLLNTSAKQVA